LNDDGEVNPRLPTDTIEVHAHFEDEKSFFGLSAFLDYVEGQLRQSYSWAISAEKRFHVQHHFPWRHLDRSNIETEGFISKQFQFTIDQVRILDLLIGHTIYNDTNVVLRELSQNAIDAVRLESSTQSKTEADEAGIVQIH
jgi:hypothetical protein